MLGRARAVSANERKWWMLEIVNGVSFAQEFGIAAEFQPVSEGAARTAAERGRYARLHRSWRNRASHDDRMRGVLRAIASTKLAHDLVEALQRGRTVHPARRTHRNEGNLAFLNGGGGIVGRSQSARGDQTGQQFGNARLHDRRNAGIDQLHLLGVDIDADDPMSQLRQAGARNDADITHAKDRKPHRLACRQIHIPIAARIRFHQLARNARANAAQIPSPATSTKTFTIWLDVSPIGCTGAAAFPGAFGLARRLLTAHAIYVRFRRFAYPRRPKRLSSRPFNASPVLCATHALDPHRHDTLSQPRQADAWDVRRGATRKASRQRRIPWRSDSPGALASALG